MAAGAGPVEVVVAAVEGLTRVVEAWAEVAALEEEAAVAEVVAEVVAEAATPTKVS